MALRSLVWITCIASLGCGDVIGNDIASIDIEPVSHALKPGESVRLNAVIRDADGNAADGRRTTWTSANKSIVDVSDDGVVTGLASGGPVLITARAGGQSAVAQVRVLPAYEVSPDIDAMFAQLGDFIQQSLTVSRDQLPLNPNNTQFINAKIALLERPTLTTEVIEGRQFHEAVHSSIDGKSRPISIVFALESMREEAASAIAHVGKTLSVLEGFFGSAPSSDQVRIWLGFMVGSSGGGGILNVEDAATYNTRGAQLPHRAILSHEMAHTYISNETMTQFLELFAYNMITTGSSSLEDWSFTRGYNADAPNNTGTHALLDVYRLIGLDPMRHAYVAARAHTPRYGQPLSAEVRQAFVDAAPDSAKTRVAALVATVTF